MATYGYDEINRLTSAATGTTTETWAYDKNGNRTVDTKTGTATIYSAYNAADQLCWAGTSQGTCTTPPAGATTYSYDANGNTTASGATTQTYNIFDQFTANTSAGTTTNYTYNGPRNDSRLTAGATSFLNGSLGITRQTTSGARTSFIRDPQGNLISMRTSTGASFYYTTDALGSVLLLTDSNQAAAATYTCDSWGNTTSNGPQATTNPWTYTGGYNDTTNNRIKLGARYYNPYRGRFTQNDPSGQETNRYLYAGATPTTYTDVEGTSFLGDVIGGAVAAFLGATLDGTVSPILGGAAGGCAGAVITGLIDNEGTLGQNCAAGIVIGAATAGFGLAGKAAGKWLKGL